MRTTADTPEPDNAIGVKSRKRTFNIDLKQIVLSFFLELFVERGRLLPE